LLFMTAVSIAKIFSRLAAIAALFSADWLI
jgi:hypothetical protein